MPHTKLFFLLLNFFYVALGMEPSPDQGKLVSSEVGPNYMQIRCEITSQSGS